MSATLSNRAINRAGDYLRRPDRAWPLDPRRWNESSRTLNAFRRRWSAWPHPLKKVDMGLRSMAFTATAGRARVSQRLKRADRIVDKLRRFPTMNLVQMQDIGGCRAVVPTLEDLHAIRARIHRNWGAAVRNEDDYVSQPRASGYRAVHVIVERDGCLVEVQLRTLRQHRWAASVEYVEQGNPSWRRDDWPESPLTEAFRDLAVAFALRDRGEPLPHGLARRLEGWLSALDLGG